MLDHLKKIGENYRGKVIKTTPICNLDTEIIFEIFVALGKLHVDDLREIVAKWKLIPDEDVRDMLLDWNTQFIKRPLKEDKESDKPTRKFGNINGNNYLVYLITSFEQEDNYNFKKGEYEYRVIMNRSDNQMKEYANTVFTFESKEERAEFILDTQAQLSQFGVDFV